MIQSLFVQEIFLFLLKNNKDLIILSGGIDSLFSNLVKKKKQDLKLIAFAKKYEEIFNFSKINLNSFFALCFNF